MEQLWESRLNKQAEISGIESQLGKAPFEVGCLPG